MTTVPVTPDLEGRLRTLLGDLVVAKFRAHGFHWNVSSPAGLFPSLHEFFGDLYGLYEGHIDMVAENLRKLGYVAPSSLQEFLAVTDIPDSLPPIGDGIGMSRDLQAVNAHVMECAMNALTAATQANQQGLVNYLAGLIDELQKQDWQLRMVIGS